MKWVIRLFILLVIAVVGVVAYAITTARTSVRPVGLQVVQWQGAQRRPMTVAIWYPTSADPKPTSHWGARSIALSDREA